MMRNVAAIFIGVAVMIFVSSCQERASTEGINEVNNPSMSIDSEQIPTEVSHGMDEGFAAVGEESAGTGTPSGLEVSSAASVGTQGEEEIPTEEDAKSIVSTALQNAKICNDLVRAEYRVYGSVSIKDGSPAIDLSEVQFNTLDEMQDFVTSSLEEGSLTLDLSEAKFKTVAEMENFIRTSFDQKTAQEILSPKVKAKPNRDVDGTIYAPAVGWGFQLTRWEWKEDTMVILEREPAKIVAEMETLFYGIVGEGKKQQLTVVKEDGHWCCTDSFIEKLE